MRKFLTKKYLQSTVIRRYRKVAAFAVLVACLFGFVFLASDTAQAPHEVIEQLDTSGEVVSGVLGAAYPDRIRIPKIGVDAVFEAPLGVDSSREIEVPEGYETVGYYKHGPTPGELGPAVVLGHVDSYQGPAVFYSLGQLAEGDTIEIDRDDGTTAVFAVDRLERHAQSGFPTRQVYGDLDYAGLRLITCSGTFDRGIQRYSHNLIVFARLVTDSEVESVEKLDI